ncbi:MAG: hypothetical protein DRP54_03180 [Spirochaetes bacterium]|nr:MAG: hypothetical protein DRP54_03180 [Spirochaetota bacterium]
MFTFLNTETVLRTTVCIPCNISRYSSCILFKSLSNPGTYPIPKRTKKWLKLSPAILTDIPTTPEFITFLGFIIPNSSSDFLKSPNF